MQSQNWPYRPRLRPNIQILVLFVPKKAFLRFYITNLIPKNPDILENDYNKISVISPILQLFLTTFCIFWSLLSQQQDSNIVKQCKSIYFKHWTINKIEFQMPHDQDTLDRILGEF